MRVPTNHSSSSALKQTMGVCALIAAALGLLMFIPNGSLFTQRAPRVPTVRTDAEGYVGEIWLAPAEDGRCRVIAFDNRSEWFWDRGLLPCDSAPSKQEQLSRLDSISKSFKRE
ncbi:MAG: hypothetical protein ACLPKB_06045 [Xanthobacteraceae bacterium]